MTFDKHELKLIAAAGVLAAPGQPVKLAWLSGVFSRPFKLRETVDKLRISQFITFDPYQSELRLLAKPILDVLIEFNQTQELFRQEHPLDAVLADQLRVSVLKDTEVCKITHGENLETLPPKPPPRVEETRGIPGVSHVLMPSMPMPKTITSSRNCHVHGSCNSGGLKKLHEHDVGEVGFRTTDQIMADILKLAPKLSGEFIKHWRERIEREDAALVNACVRQGFLQRRQIRNMAAWLNKCYLNAIRTAGLELANAGSGSPPN